MQTAVESGGGVLIKPKVNTSVSPPLSEQSRGCTSRSWGLGHHFQHSNTLIYIYIYMRGGRGIPSAVERDWG